MCYVIPYLLLLNSGTFLLPLEHSSRLYWFASTLILSYILSYTLSYILSYISSYFSSLISPCEITNDTQAMADQAAADAAAIAAAAAALAATPSSTTAPTLTITGGQNMAVPGPLVVPPASSGNAPPAAANTTLTPMEKRLMDQNDLLTQRVDQLSTMLNQLLVGMAPHTSLPNIPGWPLASAASSGAPPASAASSGTPPVPPTTANAHTPPAAPIASAAILGALAANPTPLTNLGVPASNTGILTPSQSARTGSMPSPQQMLASHPIMSSQVAPTNLGLPPAFTAAFGPAAPHRSPSPAAFQLPQGTPSGSQHNSTARDGGINLNTTDTNAISHQDLSAIPQDGNRGRGRLRGPRAQLRRRHIDSTPGDSTCTPSTDEDDDEYLANQTYREIANVRSLGIDKFSHNDKDNDWVIWANQFEDAVNRSHNPHSRRRHKRYCLRWLPSCLKPDAYAIWRRHSQLKTDWDALKEALTEAYEDPLIREQWKSSLDAYKWDKKNVSLHTYCAKVQRYVDTFDTNLKDCPAAKQEAYYLRFFHGLDAEYQQFLRLNIPKDRKDINLALDLCIRFQSSEKMGKKTESETVAAVSWEDQTVSSRITKNEVDIKRMDGKLDKILKNQEAASNKVSHDTRAKGKLPPSPHPAKIRSNSADRRQDRMNRFFKNRGMSRGGRGRGAFHAKGKPITQTKTETEEGLGLETDVELADEEGDADDTIAIYEQFCAGKAYEEFEDFTTQLDEARKAGKIAGN